MLAGESEWVTVTRAAYELYGECSVIVETAQIGHLGRTGVDQVGHLSVLHAPEAHPPALSSSYSNVLTGGGRVADHLPLAPRVPILPLHAAGQSRRLRVCRGARLKTLQPQPKDTISSHRLNSNTYIRLFLQFGRLNSGSFEFKLIN